MKKVIYISPGPIYRPRNKSYQDEFTIFANDLSGYIFTTSSKSEKLQIGGFNYISMESSGGVFSVFKFFIFCIVQAKKLKKRGVNIDLVDSYDPLKSGLIAVFISRMLQAKCVVQVNGVYTSPAEWVDDPLSFSTIIKKKLYPYIMKFVLKRADGIKLLFDAQINPFKNIVREKVIRSFPCYVDIDVFLQRAEIPNSMQKIILFVGFPFKRKGVDTLIESFKLISDKYPEWRLKILGWFPDKAELMAAINGHPKIEHLNPVQYDEMPNLISSCSILVLPSRSEAMGRVLVEAMAAGKPRIGGNVDGIPTVINDGVDGYLVIPGDVIDLADKIEKLMENEDLRLKMGNAASERAKKEFRKDVYHKNIINFYNEIIDR